MTATEPAAFWSYAHEDNEKARGAILELASLITDEYSLLKGEELRLFVDSCIRWGDEWQQRIENALVVTTFFIPVVTPRYFTREECLRELFEFTQRASGLGVSELVCPILYVPVDGLRPDSDDPAKALIAKSQYEDWTELRRKGANAPEHTEAVHRLAVRLAEVGEQVAKHQVAREEESGEDATQASLADVVGQLRRLIPDWIATTERDSVLQEQFLAADRVLEKRRRQVRTGPSGARFVIATRQVQEYLPLVEQRRKITEAQLKMATELGPLLTRLSYIVREHPEERAVLDEVWGELVQTWDIYIEHDRSKMIAVSTWARQHSHETRGMLTLAQASERADRAANEFAAQWGSWRQVYEAVVDDVEGEGEGSEEATAGE